MSYFHAAGTAGAGLLAIGVVVALVLIGAVGWGIRRRSGRAGPAAAFRPAPRGGRDHADEHREPDAATFPEDGGRLSPHEMKGYGNLGSSPSEHRRDEE